MSRPLLVIALLLLAACSSTTLAAKCWYPKTPAPPTEATLTEPPSVDTATTSAPQTEVTTAPEAPIGETAPPTEETTLTTQDSSSGPSPPSEGSSYSVPTTTGSTETTPSSPSTSTVSGAAPFGDITSASGECVIGNPTEYVTAADLDWVWENTHSKVIPNYQTWIMDQLVKNNGSLNYCIRWDSKIPLKKSVASKFQDMLSRQINLWHRWLVGYDCWPFDKVDLTVVSFAVKDKSILDWSDDSLGTIYEGILNEEGSPKCPDECYVRDSQDLSACKGTPFDMFLWPADYVGVNAIGLGSDDGQKVEVNDMLKSMDGEQMMVLLHEMGHGFGLSDMYVPENKPATFPACIMDESYTLTDADG